MSNNKVELSVNTEVLEKMAELAALEVEGVCGISKKNIDLKGAIKSMTAFKGVKAECINGAISITVFICVKEGAEVKSVAEKVQENVKEKLQTMTNTAVTKVNVVVADVCFESEEETEEEKGE